MKFLENSYAWKLHKNTDTESTKFSLRISVAETEIPPAGNEIMVVECPVLTRTWPLLDPYRKSSNRKRLESFLVAKAANIQNSDVVWDPLCQRGTILVEAAKYWPMAHYHGMDTNEGNLEHVQMNAASTRTTSIITTHRPAKLLDGNSQWKRISRIPAEDASVDKIMSCMGWRRCRFKTF